MKPDDGYIAYIINPKSGPSSSKLKAHKFKNYLLERGFHVSQYITSSLTHACELATDAAVDYDCALVVVAGGDGTVREVAHGLEGSDKPMLVIPCGTENLLANELGFNESLKIYIDTFEKGTIRPLDLGSADGKCFTCIAGFGFDAGVVKSVSRLRKGHINHFDYFWPIWRTFWSYDFNPVKVVLDEQVISDEPSLVFIGNTSRYAIGLQILHYADYGDGLLDVCIYRCSSHIRLLKHSLMTVLKHHAYTRDVIYRQGRNITVSASGRQIESQLDGDPGPALPVTIKVIPQAVKCLVPKNAKPAGIRTRIIRAIG